MISTARPSFWRLYHALPERIQAEATAAHRRFLRDPSHPSLRFKKLHGYEKEWSVRIGEQYRAVGRRTGDTIEWGWIGTHNDFDNLF